MTRSVRPFLTFTRRPGERAASDSSREPRSHALQFSHFPVSFSAAHARHVLPALTLLRAEAGEGLAHTRVALFLRLVESNLHAADRRLDAGEFHVRPAHRRGGEGGAIGHGVAHIRRHRESAPPRLFQIRQFFRDQCERRLRHALEPRADHPAARHLVFHVHADRVSRGCAPRRGVRIRPRRLPALHHILPASHRGADHPPQRDDAAVPRAEDVPLRLEQPRRGPRDFFRRAFQKGGHRGSHQCVVGQDFRSRRDRACAAHARCVGRRARIHVPALL